MANVWTLDCLVQICSQSDLVQRCPCLCSVTPSHNIWSQLSKTPRQEEQQPSKAQFMTWSGIAQHLERPEQGLGVTALTSPWMGSSCSAVCRTEEEVADTMNLAGFAFFSFPKERIYRIICSVAKDIVHGRLKHWLRTEDWAKQTSQIQNLSSGHFPFLLCMKNKREFWKISMATSPGETQIKH